MTAVDCSAPGATRAERQVVLVVEDEVLIRMLLAEGLRGEGYEVIEAANADEALSVLHTSRCPDILITDVRMPGVVDGLGLADAVLRTQPQLRVIITSGHAAAESAAGVADAFFRKPYDLDALFEGVRALTQAQ